jgi:hypothetical protein
MPAKDRIAYRRDWEAKNRLKMRDYARKKRAKADYKQRQKERQAGPGMWLRRTASAYRIEPAKLDEFLLRAEGRCAICCCFLIGAPREPNDLCIDHCHDRKEVRGILCRCCNMALGGFRDNLEVMLAAIDYLRRVAGPGG